MPFPLIFQTTLNLFLQWWWLWLPVFAAAFWWQTWLIYIRSIYYIKTAWDLLEITVPREIAKTPQAIEQAFAGLHGASRKGNLIDRYWDGFIPTWFSLEIVSRGGIPHFYIRTPRFFRQMVEAQIYAQYPRSEIRIVDDYVDDVPPTAPDENWNMYGSEFTFTKPDAYPILTYPSFHITEGTKEEEEKVDPISALLEFFGSLSKDEHMWLQILIRPADEKWKEAGEKLIDKMIGKKTKIAEKKGLAALGAEIINWILTVKHETDQLTRAALDLPQEGLTTEKKKEKDKKEEVGTSLWQHMPKGEQEVVVAMQRKLSKLGFETGIRFCYIARRDRYTIMVYPALIGIMKQFNSQSLNGFRPKNSASVDYPPLKQRREAWKKRALLALYRERSWFYPPYQLFRTPSALDPRYWFGEKTSFISRLDPTTNGPSKPIILSTEELATIYHFPGMVAAAPSIERIEAKKVEPPPNLPLG